MNCCPSADLVFLDNGVRVAEKNVQADGYTLQFFPYRAIQSVRYSYTRGERGGTLSIWIMAGGAGAGTGSASGMSYRYCFPCGETGKELFEQLLTRLS